MSTTPWLCPVCHRRVPADLTECRCGTARPANPLGGQKTALPWDVKAWIAFAILMVLGGLVSLFLPQHRKPIIPLLGWSAVGEAPPPMPTPSPVRKAGRR